MSEEKNIVVIYHANCPDGFGGAFAAWKKLGDSAEYRALGYGGDMPEDLAGKEVYFIDFCYDQAHMDAIKNVAGSLTVLDHHEGVEAVTKSMPNFVYDDTRSGATIAWSFFHPETPVPYLLSIVEDDDLFRYRDENTKPLLTYLSVMPFSFEFWNALSRMLDDAKSREDILVKARTYREYFDLLTDQAVERAKRVSFEGYEVFLGITHPMKPMVSSLGNKLARKQGPFGLVPQIKREGIAISMRGDGSIDLTKIAQKYGGNGHPNSSAFFIPWGTPLPWTYIDEDSSN